MKFTEGPQENKPHIPEEGDLIAQTFQNIAGDAYTEMNLLLEEIKYNSTLTPDQIKEKEERVRSLAATLEGADAIAVQNTKFEKDNGAIEIPIEDNKGGAA